MAQLDIPQYLGRWYELARHNATFESDCTLAVAEYSLEGGQIKAVNTCYQMKPGLTWHREIIGMITPTTDPYKFGINFNDGHAGLYEIKFTDYTNWSIISGMTPGYVSILGRRPYITSGERTLLMKVAKDFGFNTLSWTFFGKQAHRFDFLNKENKKIPLLVVPPKPSS